MFLKSAVLPFRKIWMERERCLFRKRCGTGGIRELVFREHPDKRLLQGYHYWFYDHFEDQLKRPVNKAWASESTEEIINLWLNTQIAHTGPKPDKKRKWEFDLSDFNRCVAKIGREKFEFLFRSSIETIGCFYALFGELLAIPLFKKFQNEGMKPSFEADFALKYNPYPDPNFKIQFDDVFWHLNRETQEETFRRLLARKRFSALQDFLHSLFKTAEEALGEVNRAEDLDTMLKQAKVIVLGENQITNDSQFNGHFCNNADYPGGISTRQIRFDAFTGRRVRFSADSQAILNEVYIKFRATMLEARQQQRKPDVW